jgi:hypothetical protein
MLHLVQIRPPAGARAVVAVTEEGAAVVPGVESTYQLATAAMRLGHTLRELVANGAKGAAVDLDALLASGAVLPPIDHPDPAHMMITGTGLSHLGSAEGRDKMHRSLDTAAQMTDSMRMFRAGLDGGKPPTGQRGVQPEWFWKGDGSTVVAPEGTLFSPDFALDAGEEPEIVGIYIIAPDGQPRRLGFALANEFSDHVLERENYLYLAHSKLRPCGLGGEILTGDLPNDIQGVSRIRRAGTIVWERPFLTGEENMSHAIANLEAHHFKYPLFRRPGDIHVHFFGTATLSFTDGIRVLPGDVFEIEAPPFRLPLRNRLGIAEMNWAKIVEL